MPNTAESRAHRATHGLGGGEAAVPWHVPGEGVLARAVPAGAPPPPRLHHSAAPAATGRWCGRGRSLRWLLPCPPHAGCGCCCVEAAETVCQAPVVMAVRYLPPALVRPSNHAPPTPAVAPVPAPTRPLWCPAARHAHCWPCRESSGGWNTAAHVCPGPTPPSAGATWTWSAADCACATGCARCPPHPVHRRAGGGGGGCAMHDRGRRPWQ